MTRRAGPLLVVSLACLSLPASGQSSADTTLLRLNGTDWRLHGVELPDPNQTCADGWAVGEQSRNAIRRLTEGAQVDCKITAKDQYSRPVATCLVNGDDLGAILVRQGMAWASLRATWRYVIDDWVAWFDDSGLHAHPCEQPSVWRTRNKAR